MASGMACQIDSNQCALLENFPELPDLPESITESSFHELSFPESSPDTQSLPSMCPNTATGSRLGFIGVFQNDWIHILKQLKEIDSTMMSAHRLLAIQTHVKGMKEAISKMPCDHVRKELNDFLNDSITATNSETITSVLRTQ